MGEMKEWVWTRGGRCAAQCGLSHITLVHTVISAVTYRRGQGEESPRAALVQGRQNRVEEEFKKIECWIKMKSRRERKKGRKRRKERKKPSLWSSRLGFRCRP